MSRINNRLAKLEAGKNQQTQEQMQMLIEVLARRDAIWWPRRTDPKHNFPLVMQRRRDDLEGKYGVSAKSSGRSEWGAAMDHRNALIAQGLCSPIRSAGGEVSGLSITPAGESAARALVGRYTLADILPKLIFLYMTLRQETTKGRLWEGLLWQRTLAGYASDWEHLTEPMLPLLTAGIVEATFDTVGRVYYWVKTDQYPEVTKSELEYDSSFVGQYYDAYDAEVNMLEQLEPDSEIYIPLPANIGLHEFHPDDHDAMFFEKRSRIEDLETILGNYGPVTHRQKEA